MKYIQYRNLKLKERIKLRIKARHFETLNGKCTMELFINGISYEVWNVPCKKIRKVSTN